MVSFAKLKCNGRINPDCIDNAPLFSWSFDNDYERNVVQKFFTITIKNENGDVVLNKRARSSKMQYEYSLKDLKPMTNYVWYVTAELSNKKTVMSGVQKFSTGILNGSFKEYGAKQIVGSKKYESQAIKFNKNFRINGNIKSAYAYIFTSSWHRTQINGIALKEDCFLMPPNSSYKQRCIYEKYDLTDLLKQGDNEFSVHTGGGYNSGYCRWGWNITTGKYLIGFIDVIYTDGTTDRIVSDDTWEIYNSNITYCDIYNGESFDANITPAKIENAIISNRRSKALFVANEMPPIKLARKVKPISYYNVGNSRIYDFGENFAGFCEITLTAPKGTKIKLKHSELIYQDGKQRLSTNKQAKAEDSYICCGKSNETFRPEFTYHCFRYVKVSGVNSKVENFDIIGYALSTDIEWESKFICSDNIVNSIHENSVRGLRNNLYSIPTDCPVRAERTPCAMDSICSEPGALYNFDVQSYYRKWVVDILQGEDTASDHGNPDWDGDKIVATYRLIKFYDDMYIAKRYYKELKGCILGLKAKSPDNLWHDGFGDWCHPITVDSWEGFHSCVDVVNSCMYYKIVSHMADIAGMLKKYDDQKMFFELANDIKTAFNATYVKPNGIINDGIHAEQVMALYVKILPEDKEQLVLETLINKMKSEPHDLGIFGISALSEVLPRFNKCDFLLEFLRNPNYPGFLYQLANGATTLWESWVFDGAMASHSHAMFASIERAFFRGFAGIKPLANAFTSFEIRPQAPNSMNFVECVNETVSGIIKIKLKKHDAGTELKVSIPVNTHADVYIPHDNSDFALYDGEKIMDAKHYERCGKYIKLKLGSGIYDLRAINKKYAFENTVENEYKPS